MNFAKILYGLKLNEKFLLSLRKVPKVRRTFLSEAYQCQEAWNNRLKNSLLSKINVDDFYLELNNKVESNILVPAIDIDIFTNCVQKHNYVEEIGNLLHKLRLTTETSNTLDSTHHAVVRYFIDMGEAQSLLSILNDRLNYGIFCDYLCYNLLMDHFIKKQDFASAAKTATFMMLQEEFDNPISNALAIYSCHNYLKNPDTWIEKDPETLKNEPKEEIKIRVKYLRNPYFDDHFDLWKPSDLVGKTLWWIGETMNDVIGRSCQLRGLILYNKYSEAIELLKKWKDEEIQNVVYKETIPLIENDAPDMFISGENSTESQRECQLLITDLQHSDLNNGNMDEDITNLVKKAVDAHSQEDITNQVQIYEEWIDVRMKILREQHKEREKQQRLANIENIKKELEEKEQLLTFFDNEDKIELQIEQKLEKEKLLYGEVKVTKQEEDYVPPEIKKRQNQ
ncbi:PREDICTED: uncharacterized protein LOC105362585 [Ceratosolen solmsi marchali]|uniref:Uncharacterized protein LOC105362585 n=1 Tax=Ceratosolen solmsi marchali TaxID=326594 RepID=A0AAJ6YHV3_9HYME|nr:PREDICTED: uncharacterized protein LOC105362585 [Ceratosolen solmsi marchali]XP_011498351.1 PREDICTED: uncharacterized protein LOC105362585 [Ceratosolen solmsi marchali]